MENRIPNIEDRRGGEPQRIGDILAELMTRFERPFPAAGIAVAQQALVVMEDQSCLFYPAELASVS